MADDELPAKVFHDVFNVVNEPKVKVELGSSLDWQLKEGEENAVVNEILATLREHFDGITATNMNDLMRLTNNKIPQEQRVEHEIQVKVDSDPVKQKHAVFHTVFAGILRRQYSRGRLRGW